MRAPDLALAASLAKCKGLRPRGCCHPGLSPRPTSVRLPRPLRASQEAELRVGSTPLAGVGAPVDIREPFPMEKPLIAPRWFSRQGRAQ